MRSSNAAVKTRPVDEAALKSFLCDRYWLPETDFPLCGDLFHALGLTGDDCHEFMNDFSDLFDVDLVDYVWPKYHLGESEAMDVRAALRPLRRFVGLKARPLDRDLIPISIDHMMSCIVHGSWYEPEFDQNEDISHSFGQSLSWIGAKLRAGGIPRKPHR